MINKLFGVFLIIACAYGIYWLQERIDSNELPNIFAVERAKKGQIMMGLGIATGVFLVFKKIKYKEKDPFEELEDY